MTTSITLEHKSPIDPAHTRDPSGCTAVAALVTNDGKIYVVSNIQECDMQKLIPLLG